MAFTQRVQIAVAKAARWQGQGLSGEAIYRPAHQGGKQ